MAILHLLSQSPWRQPLDSVLRLLGADDALLLCGDACQALHTGSDAWTLLQALPETVRLYALLEDLQARDLGAPDRVTPVDYPAFVALCVQYDKVNGWL
jgi:tRNA 2-thiouridine synthesizing protein B